MALSDFLNRYRTLSFYSQYSPIKLNESQKKYVVARENIMYNPKVRFMFPKYV